LDDGTIKSTFVFMLFKDKFRSFFNYNQVYRHLNMKQLFFFIILFVTMLNSAFSFPNQNFINVAPNANEVASTMIKNQPVKFIENKGQMMDMDSTPVSFVLFKAEAPGMNMYITEKGLTYVFIKAEEEEKVLGNKQLATGNEKNKEGKPSLSVAEEGNKIIHWARVDMDLKGASIKKENILREGAGTSDFNFFLGHCPDGIYGVKQYEKIIIKDVYPGIDWMFYNSTEKGFKYDFIVHPGADPSKIKLLYRSKEKLNIDKAGNINIKTPYGILTEDAPVSYLQNTQVTIPTQFITERIDEYNATHKDKGYETSISFNLPSSFKLGTSNLIIPDYALEK